MKRHLFTNSLAGLRAQAEIDGQRLPVVGLLGSNVVLRRSLHLNLSQNLFEWSGTNPLKAASVRSPRWNPYAGHSLWRAWLPVVGL